MKKKLYKIEDGKKLEGVCNGIAAYFDLDPTVIRIAWVLLTCLSAGFGIIAYIGCALVMPKEPDYIEQ